MGHVCSVGHISAARQNLAVGSIPYLSTGARTAAIASSKRTVAPIRIPSCSHKAVARTALPTAGGLQTITNGVRPFRGKDVVARAWIVPLAALAAWACGSTAQPSTTTLYTVTSTVMQWPGEAPHACFATAAPYPPIGCGGPDIRGLDLASVPSVTRYQNGVLATGILRLVGTWDGRALTLTQPPQGASATNITLMPECAQEPGRSSADPIPPVMERVMKDEAVLRSHGVQLLEFYPCKGTVFLGLAVANQKSIDFLTSRYGHVEVGGWLQPLT
jgi:hypothetical protein